ncbi:MAG: RecX family transcriptional regulator [Brevinematales bacterium]|nr:RecX family transcriptional regulator [Brevinematales bacterium]
MNKDILLKTLRYVSIKPRTSKEIQDYLEKKLNLNKEVINEVLEYLKQNGYIDDEFIKDSIIRSKISKGFGPNYIKMKLLSRGLSSNLEIEPNINKAVEIVKRKYSSELHSGYNQKVVSKIIRFLSYRGFTPSQISEILKKVIE